MLACMTLLLIPRDRLYTGEIYNILLNFTNSVDNSTRYAFGACNLTVFPTFIVSDTADDNGGDRILPSQYLQTPVLMDWTTFVDSSPWSPVSNFISWRVPSRRDITPLPMYPGRYRLFASVTVFDFYNVSTAVDYTDPSLGLGQIVVTAQSGAFMVVEAQ
ncbi:hypothetical protein HDU93_007307 [Gonapodya sp. JEL0774]|nr:hypothetical protein HDU93_007307 [Gonapodya sp. JEL0774]